MFTQLYAIADKYGIESLQRLVTYKLHQTLTDYELYEGAVSGLIEFIREVCQNTPDYEQHVDPLRDLTSRHAVTLKSYLARHPMFEDLLYDGGPFVVYFWRVMHKDSH